MLKIICFNIYQNKHLKCLLKPYLVLNQNYETYILTLYMFNLPNTRHGAPS